MTSCMVNLAKGFVRHLFTKKQLLFYRDNMDILFVCENTH